MSISGLCSALLVVALVAAPLAESQHGIIGSLLNLVRVQGTVYCTANGNAGVQGTDTPTFSDALVEMQCGRGAVVSSVQTNENGTFSILLDPAQLLLSFLLDNCNLVVITPLSACNAELPSSGSLEAPLKTIGNAILGLFNVTDVIPVGFQFQPLL